MYYDGNEEKQWFENNRDAMQLSRLCVQDVLKLTNVFVEIHK